jgi:hypothetical protein
MRYLSTLPDLLGAFGPVLILPLLLEFEDGELEVSSKFERSTDHVELREPARVVVSNDLEWFSSS